MDARRPADLLAHRITVQLAPLFRGKLQLLSLQFAQAAKRLTTAQLRLSLPIHQPRCCLFILFTSAKLRFKTRYGSLAAWLLASKQSQKIIAVRRSLPNTKCSEMSASIRRTEDPTTREPPPPRKKKRANLQSGLQSLAAHVGCWCNLSGEKG